MKCFSCNKEMKFKYREEFKDKFIFHHYGCDICDICDYEFELKDNVSISELEEPLKAFARIKKYALHQLNNAERDIKLITNKLNELKGEN